MHYSYKALHTGLDHGSGSQIGKRDRLSTSKPTMAKQNASNFHPVSLLQYCVESTTPALIQAGSRLGGVHSYGVLCVYRLQENMQFFKLLVLEMYSFM